MKKAREWFNTLHYQTRLDIAVTSICVACGVAGIVAAAMGA
jgi:hypothetical protein